MLYSIVFYLKDSPVTTFDVFGSYLLSKSKTGLVNLLSKS